MSWNLKHVSDPFTKEQGNKKKDYWKLDKINSFLGLWWQNNPEITKSSDETVITAPYTHKIFPVKNPQVSKNWLRTCR